MSKSTIRVRYADTDKMGVAYHANFLVWFEVARSDWLRNAGLAYAEMESRSLYMPVIEASCRYLHPARYDDLLTVEAEGGLVGRAKIRFDYRVIRDSDKRTLSEGYTVHVPADQNGRPVRLDSEIRSLFLEGSREEKQGVGRGS